MPLYSIMSVILVRSVNSLFELMSQMHCDVLRELLF